MPDCQQDILGRCLRENRNLKQKVAAYENGEAFQKAEDEYFRKLAKLENENDRLSARAEKAEAGQRKSKEKCELLEEELKKAREELANVHKENASLIKNNTKLESENRELRESEREKKKEIRQKNKEIRDKDRIIEKKEAKIEKLEQTITGLKAKKSKDSTNSSSTQKPRKPVPNSRQKSGKKPGAQKGHKGYGRRDLEANAFSVLNPPEEVRLNPGDYIEVPEKARTRKTVGIRLELEVTALISRCWKNRKTGKLVWAAFPEGVSNEINYCPSLKSFLFLMTQQCNVSIRKASEFMKELSGGQLKVSAGFINGLIKEFSFRTKEDREQIFEALAESFFQNADTTYIHVDGKLKYYQITVNKDYVLFQFRDKKGKEAVKGTPTENYDGVVVHDHDVIYYSLPGIDHQECLAHLIRQAKGAHDDCLELKWPLLVKDFLSGLIHRFNQGELTGKEEIQAVRAEYDSLMDAGVLEYNAKPTLYQKDGFNLLMRLINFKEAVLYFLDHPEIPPTNNNAESMARVSKRWERCSGGHRSAEIAENRGDAMSVLQTWIKQNINIYEASQQVFSRSKQKGK